LFEKAGRLKKKRRESTFSIGLHEPTESHCTTLMMMKMMEKYNGKSKGGRGKPGEKQEADEARQ